MEFQGLGGDNINTCLRGPMDAEEVIDKLELAEVPQRYVSMASISMHCRWGAFILCAKPYLHSSWYSQPRSEVRPNSSISSSGRSMPIPGAVGNDTEPSTTGRARSCNALRSGDQ